MLSSQHFDSFKESHFNQNQNLRKYYLSREDTSKVPIIKWVAILALIDNTKTQSLFFTMRNICATCCRTFVDGGCFWCGFVELLTSKDSETLGATLKDVMRLCCFTLVLVSVGHTFKAKVRSNAMQIPISFMMNSSSCKVMWYSATKRKRQDSGETKDNEV
jgi:hypothetical protein